MSTTTATLYGAGSTASRPRQVYETPRVNRRTLIRVELRKLMDTRAGIWLLVGTAVTTAAVVAVFMFAADSAELTYGNFVNATGTPQGVLLPLLGILAVTSEWGQRTGLVTFTLEPHRGRVVTAKLAATIVMGGVAVLVALGVGALANIGGATWLDGNGSWAFGVDGLRDVAVLQLVGVVQGVAFGMLLMNSAAAIVTYFALPTVWGILTSTVDWFADIGGWVDLNTTSVPLTSHQMDGDAWLRLGVSVTIWVLVPLVLGVVRLLRREVKSA